MVHFEFWQESLFLLRYSATALAEERVFPLGIPTLVGNLIVRLNFLSPPLFFGIFIVCAGGGR